MFISVTLLKLNNPLKLFQFLKLSGRAIMQAKGAAGNLHTSARGSLKLAFYTLTVWESERHMREYMRSGAHREAMKHTSRLAKHLQSTHFEQDTIPTWPEAINKLKSDPNSDRTAAYIR